MIRTMLAALWFSGPSCAAAQPDSYSFEAPAYYYNSAVAACGVQATVCLKMQWDKAEKELAATFQGRFSYLPDKSEADGLRAAQQAWSVGRDKSCSWLAKRQRTEIYYLCMLDATINRKYWLLRNIGD